MSHFFRKSVVGELKSMDVHIIRLIGGIGRVFCLNISSWCIAFSMCAKHSLYIAKGVTSLHGNFRFMIENFFPHSKLLVSVINQSGSTPGFDMAFTFIHSFIRSSSSIIKGYTFL